MVFLIITHYYNAMLTKAPLTFCGVKAQQVEGFMVQYYSTTTIIINVYTNEKKNGSFCKT